MKNLNILIKASLKTHRIFSVFYFTFVFLSSTLILLSISVIFPLKSSIDSEITNHISNRELIYHSAESETSDDNLSKIKKTEDVMKVYPMPFREDVKCKSDNLKGAYELGFFHFDYEPVIKTGKSIDEKDKNTAVVPEKIMTVDSLSDNKTEISGKDLIGKTITFYNDFFNYKATVIGAYDNSDLIFDKNEIIIPQADLIRLNSKEGNVNKDYIITVQNAHSVEKIMNNLSEFFYVDKNDIGLDSELYSIAVYILISSLLVFIILAIVGNYVFIKYNINHRKNEFALYRSLGYKTKHIFYLVFNEYFIINFSAMLITAVFSVLLCKYLVNPFVKSLVETSVIKNININLNLPELLAVVLSLVIALVIVCVKFVKQSEKMDLTILLNE